MPDINWDRSMEQADRNLQCNPPVYDWDEREDVAEDD